MISLVRGRVAAAVVMLASSPLTSCLDNQTADRPWTLACPAQPGSAVTLVVGARANSPRTQLASELQLLVRRAALSQQKVQVVRIDGVPTVALTATFATSGNNDKLRERDLTNFVKQTTQFVSDLQPKEPEADILGALTKAGQITPEGGTIVLMDSGLATAGPLSYKNADMFGADPDQVVAFLTDQHLMPDLKGRNVVLTGLGDTADPQPQLAGNLHEQVGKLWRTVVTKAGAGCVGDLRAAPTRTATATTVAVSIVEPPAPPTFVDCGTTVLADSSAVGFIVGKAEFRDQAAAKSTLQSLATTLIGHTQQVTLIGTTSSEGSDADNQRLSELRSQAVKTVLVQLGVPDSRITAVGKGEHWQGREVDTTKDGVLIPTAAAHNRSVVVQLTCRQS